MFKIEFELQEPSIEGRLIDTDHVRWVFDSKIGEWEDEEGVEHQFEPPKPGAKYVTAADWAKDVDFTVIITLRYDVTPVRLVAFERVNKRAWPEMTARFDARVREYPGKAIFDAGGVGGVVEDYIEVEAVGFFQQGRPRMQMYSDYVLAFEHHKLKLPKIKSMLNEHTYAVVKDIEAGGHPPDTISACALAWRCVLGKEVEASKKRPGKILRPRRF